MNHLGSLLHGTVCALLRLNWLGAQERREFHRTHPADIFVLPRRPNFMAGQINPKTGKKFTGDATEYAWFVWSNNRTGGNYFVL